MTRDTPRARLWAPATRYRLLASAIALCVCAPTSRAQSPPSLSNQPSLTIEGRILDYDGIGLRGARIVATVGNTVFGSGDSAERGHYRVTVPSGPYRLSVSKTGYVPIVLDQPKGIRQVDVSLVRGAVIAGRIVDVYQDPVVGLAVHVGGVDAQDVEREYVSETDDLGEFRIGSLPAGRYTIRMSRAPVAFDPETKRLSMPQVERFASTSEPRDVVVKAATEIAVDLVYFSGPDVIQRAEIQTRSFNADRARGRSAFRRPVAEGRTSIHGWVTDRQGLSVRGASIELEPVTGGAAQMGHSGEDGSYAIGDVAAGEYGVWIRKPGFVATQHDAVIVLRPNVPRALDLTATRGSVVSGMVVNAFGDPVGGVAVELHRPRYLSGRALLVEEGLPTVRLTDDRGRFRFPGVDPGSYYLSVSTADRQLFYPGRPLAEATRLQVESGRDLPGIDMTLPREPAVRVFGRVAGGTATGRVLVALVESVRGSPAAGRPRIVEAPSGTFEFNGVAAGEYALQVIEWSGASRPPSLAFGVQHLTVSGEDVGPLQPLPLPTTTARGRVQVAGDWVMPAGAVLVLPFTLAVLPADLDHTPLDDIRGGALAVGPLAPFGTSPTVAADWTFVATNITGPVRFALNDPPPHWWLRSVMVGSVNAVLEPVTPANLSANLPVEAVLSDDAASLEGRVTRDRNQTPSRVTVIAFSTSPSKWFYGSQYVQWRGLFGDRFTLASLPPDEYFVVAVDHLPLDANLVDWQSVPALEALAAHGRRVKLGPHSEATLDLRLTRVP